MRPLGLSLAIAGAYAVAWGAILKPLERVPKDFPELLLTLAGIITFGAGYSLFWWRGK